MKTCLINDDFSYPEIGYHFHLHNKDYPELHDHNYWEFFIVISGSIEHVTEQSNQIISEGLAFLIHPSDKHKFEKHSSDYQQINLAISDENIKTMLSWVDKDLYNEICSVPHPLMYEIDDNTMNDILNTIHLAQTYCKDNKTKFINFIKLIWTDIIKVIYKKNIFTIVELPDWLNDFLIKIRMPNNISKPVSELYKLTYFSYSHLTRLFKQYMKVSLGDYLTSVRINYSAMLLRTTDLNILQISLRVGYDSLSHFIHIFKAFFKVTPKQYRLQHKNKK